MNKQTLFPALKESLSNFKNWGSLEKSVGVLTAFFVLMGIAFVLSLIF